MAKDGDCGGVAKRHFKPPRNPCRWPRPRRAVETSQPRYDSVPEATGTAGRLRCSSEFQVTSFADGAGTFAVQIAKSFGADVTRRPCNAVSAATGTEAACSNVTFSGLLTSADSEAQAYSAKAPRQQPNTASPGLSCATFLPTASTSPATSRPSRVSFGLRSPVNKRTRYGVPRKSRSSGLTAAARTFNKTSSSPAIGFSISSHLRTSG